MIQRLLKFLDASPVNFLAARNICTELEQAGYRRLDPCVPIGDIAAGLITPPSHGIYIRGGRKYVR